MASIKAIRTKYIQCHNEVILDDLPSTGIITITGENSEGKSVVTKAFRAFISGQLSSLNIRKSLVNWDKDWAEIEIERDDGALLKAHITIEARDTFIEYSDPKDDSTVYTRYLRDGGYDDLVSEFGLHWDKDHGMSLNVYETFDPLLFVNTSPSVNDAMLSYCLSDPRVERSIENQNSFVDHVENDIQQLISEQMSIRAALSSIVVYDLPMEHSYRDKFEVYEKNITALVKADNVLPDIPQYTKYGGMNLSPLKKLVNGIAKAPKIPEFTKLPNLNQSKIVRLVGYIRKLPSISDVVPAPRINPQIHLLWSILSAKPTADICALGQEWMQACSDIASLEDKTCPTCGRRLLTDA